MLRDKGEMKRGDVVKIDGQTAFELWKEGIVEYLDKEIEAQIAQKSKKPESAMAEPPENEMMPSPGPKKFGKR